MNDLEELQKALDKIEIHTNFDELHKNIEDFRRKFSVFKVDHEKQMTKAKEKEVEYAKLVAGQAEDYAAKMNAFKADNVVISRKELVDILDDVHDKSLKDFINSLLKTHFSEDSE